MARPPGLLLEVHRLTVVAERRSPTRRKHGVSIYAEPETGAPTLQHGNKSQSLAGHDDRVRALLGV